MMNLGAFSDESEALSLLEKLVGIESINPVYGGSGEAAVSAFVCSWLKERGIDFRLQELEPGRANVIARIGNSDAPALLLEAHLDTVGVGGWADGSPFALRERGNRYYGRGACDTKASLACFMMLVAHFSAHPEQLNRPIVFAATVDEESEQIGAFELAKLKDDLGIGLAITGEPTRSDVIAKHKGVGRYLITTRGKAAHASTPELGENAIYKAAKICEALSRHASEIEGRSVSNGIDRGSLNVGCIQGGIGFNIVPDSCRLDIDRRLGALESMDKARSDLERICHSEAGSEFSVFLERPALRGENSSEFVAGLLSSSRDLACAIQERQAAYMTNAVAYEAVGIPSVVMGPGDIAQAHKNDEFIEAGEMLKTLRILHRFLIKG